MKKIVKKIVLIILCIALVGITCFAGLNGLVVLKSSQYILNEKDAEDLTDIDCVLVLGCAVYNNTTLSPFLEDRVNTGINIYNNGASDRILMSGDHGTENYDEVNNMKKYCIEKGIEANTIFLDHAGFSTYESMYRAKEIFGVKKIIIVTQKYHLYRAVYIARSLGIEAYGVAADIQEYSKTTMIKNNVRESLARIKDVFTCIAKPEPTYLGDAIPINGDARLSDDKEYV